MKSLITLKISGEDYFKMFKLYSKHKETIHNFSWRSLQIFGKQGITFLIFILCAKLLTPYDFGIYSYILAIIFFLVMFGDFGISTATSKYVAEYNITNKQKLKSVLFNSSIIILCLTFIVTLLTLVIGPWCLKDKYPYVLWLLPLIFLAPMTSLYDGIYRGLKKFKQSAIISLTVGFISIVFVYFLIKSYGLVGALISQNFFYFLLFVTLNFFHKEFKLKIDKKIMSDIAKYSFLIGVANFGVFLYIKFDVLILGWFNYMNEIAYYELANKLFMILALPISIFSQVVAPNITRLSAKNEYKKIKLKIKKYFIYSIVIGIPICLISYLIIKPLVIYLLPQYNNYYFYLFFNFLLIIFPIRIFGAILSTSFIISTGQAKIITYNNLIFGALNVVMDIFFIYTFGFVGVIYSTIILGYISILVAYYYFQKSIHKLSRMT
jgi:O-antigen/teichoic acid export membrane protein